MFFLGLTKLKILPRHWFGKVQTALFHKFMMGGILLNGTMLSTFIIRHPFDTWKDDTLYMVGKKNTEFLHKLLLIYRISIEFWK